MRETGCLPSGTEEGEGIVNWRDAERWIEKEKCIPIGLTGVTLDDPEFMTWK
jgi:hypothetical protein